MRNCNVNGFAVNSTSQIFLNHAQPVADLGYKVLPVIGKDKHRLPNGCIGASTDPAIIAQWAAQWPYDNIAIKCDNCLVIDSDIGADKDGEADLAEIAQELGPLPDGPAVITGSGGRHRYFKRPDVDVTGSVGVKWKGRKTAIDIRVENQYVVVPPSIHPETGTPYRWERPLVPVEELPEIPQKWIDGFLLTRNKRAAKCTESPVAVPAGANSTTPAVGQWITTPDEDLLIRIYAYLDKCEPAAQGQIGHSMLFTVANSLTWGFGLDPRVAAEIAWKYYNPRCIPPWTDAERAEFDRKFTEAATKPIDKPFKYLWNQTSCGDGLTPVGQIDPKTGQLVLDVSRTLPTAEAFIRDRYSVNGVPTLRYYKGFFYAWRDNAYRPMDDDGLESELLFFLHDAVTQHITPSGKVKSIPFPAKDTTVSAALKALQSVSYLPADTLTPCWLSDNPPPASDPTMIIFCKSLNLDLVTMQTFDPDPRYFNFGALDFDYNPTNSVCPEWDKFLFQLFDNDLESMETLLEFMGLLLILCTKFQKSLFVVGPKRSGKGTISKIMRQLVGSRNSTSPTTDTLSGRFGLQQLIGMTAATVNDARFSGQNLSVLVERILNISGEDEVAIDRKGIPVVTMRLPTRFAFFSNEVPRLTDASGALASRFIFLKLTKSFYGCEDLELENKLLGELPGILNQCISALQNLLKRGKFIQPSAALDEVELMGDLASPVVQFVRDKCILAPGKWSSTDDLFEAWKNWCEEQGIKPVGSITFARNLKAAFPELSKSRPAAHGGRAYGYEGIALKSAATLTTEIPPKKAEVWENLENRPETKLTPLPHWAIPPRNGR